MRADTVQVREEAAGALGRAGWLATAALYLLLALLSLRVALTGRAAGDRPSAEGALRLVSDQPLGVALLSLLALGFGAHALWRLAQAIGDRDRVGGEPRGLAKRAGYGAIALWYAALAALTVAVAAGRAPEEGVREEQATRDALGWPLGRELVIAVGLGFLAASIGSVILVAHRRHVARLRPEATPSEARDIAAVAGTAGYCARAIVFAIIGGLLVKAGWQHDPASSVGLDGALLRLTQAPYGSLLLAAMAAGFAAFALWALLQAFYRQT